MFKRGGEAVGKSTINVNIRPKNTNNVPKKPKLMKAPRQPKTSQVGDKKPQENVGFEDVNQGQSQGHLREEQDEETFLERPGPAVVDDDSDGKLNPRGRGQQTTHSSTQTETAMDFQQQCSTLSLPQTGEIFDNVSRYEETQKVTKNMLQRIIGLEEKQAALTQATNKMSDDLVAGNRRSLITMRRIEQRIVNIEAEMQHNTNSLNEIQVNIRDTVEELKTAVKDFRDVAGAPSGPTTSRSEGLELTDAVLETPKEFCHVQFQDKRYALELTRREEENIRAATTNRGVVRRILMKYYTEVELQQMTLKGKGVKGTERPQFPGWLVELIQEAVKKINGVQPPQAGEHESTTKLREYKVNTLRQSVRRSISYICQYARDTRDSEGNMKKRRKRSESKESMSMDTDSGEDDEGDYEESSPEENSL